jgi:hypothetical protein
MPGNLTVISNARGKMGVFLQKCSKRVNSFNVHSIITFSEKSFFLNREDKVSVEPQQAPESLWLPANFIFNLLSQLSFHLPLKVTNVMQNEPFKNAPSQKTLHMSGFLATCTARFTEGKYSSAGHSQHEFSTTVYVSWSVRYRIQSFPFL